MMENCAPLVMISLFLKIKVNQYAQMCKKIDLIISNKMELYKLDHIFIPSFCCYSSQDEAEKQIITIGIFSSLKMLKTKLKEYFVNLDDGETVAKTVFSKLADGEIFTKKQRCDCANKLRVTKIKMDELRSICKDDDFEDNDPIIIITGISVVDLKPTVAQKVSRRQKMGEPLTQSFQKARTSSC